MLYLKTNKQLHLLKIVHILIQRNLFMLKNNFYLDVCSRNEFIKIFMELILYAIY